MTRRPTLLALSIACAAVALLLVHTQAHAEDAAQVAARDANVAVAADVGITVAAIAAHVAVEANPLALPGIPITLLVIAHAKTLPPEDGVPMMQAVATARWAAAGWGLCIVASGGACAIPAALAGGIAWSRGTDERAFYDECKRVRVLFGNPELRCVWRG